METEHLGGDILADRRLTREELRAALSSLLAASLAKVIVYEDWQELPKEHDGTGVYCRCWHPEAGEFRTVIDLPDNLLAGLPRYPTASQLAALLGCRLLVDDGSINPFTFLLFDDKGDFQRVSIDVDASDRNEFVIAKRQGQ
jgi:hypothetical protein